MTAVFGILLPRRVFRAGILLIIKLLAMDGELLCAGV